jgi:hypothetical protein
MRTRDDDDDLRSELGQTLTLFGMSVAVVLWGCWSGWASSSVPNEHPVPRLAELGRKDSNLD